jgi:hypothetical protein
MLAASSRARKKIRPRSSLARISGGSARTATGVFQAMLSPAPSGG